VGVRVIQWRGAVGGLPFPSSRILLAGFADFGFYARVK